MLITLVETKKDCLEKLFKTVKTARWISQLARQRIPDRQTSHTLGNTLMPLFSVTSCCIFPFRSWSVVFVQFFLGLFLPPVAVVMCLFVCHVDVLCPNDVSRSSCDLHDIVAQPFQFSHTRYEPHSSQGIPRTEERVW